MRIISGKYKGKKLIQPIDKETRPLKDLTKESIFNIIIHSNKFSLEISNAKVLDLFSGTGSFGIECLSRGFKEVVFIENYLGVLPILKKNLSNLKSLKNYKIIEKNIYDENVSLKSDIVFDIIFLDPPFKDKNLEKIFKQIHENQILSKDGIIIIHRHINNIDSLKYNNTKKTASYLSVFNNQFADWRTTKRRHKRIKVYLFLKSRLNIIYKSIIYKEYRVWLFKRLTDKNWYKEKLIQLGIKNNITK